MSQRFIYQALCDALGDTRVVLLNGARQTGKSTLVQKIAAERGGQYLTLDDPVVAALARSDPDTLVRRVDKLLVIDEVQFAPELFPSLKRVVDQDPRPGRFLLTGSANIFMLPRLSESLAGRIEVLPLHPLSQAEICARPGAAPSNLVDLLFAKAPLPLRTFSLDRPDLCQRIIAGGFPEAIARTAGKRRDAWFRSYIESLLKRDIRDLAQIEGFAEMPRLLGLLAARPSALMNVSEISRAAGIALSTLRRYLALLEATFIFQPLAAWSTNLGKRFVKAPKIHLLDSGLTAHLRGETDAAALTRSPSLGPLLETFVVQEVIKLLCWSKQTATPWHCRTVTGQEVDLVLEAPGQRIVGIEIKATANLSANDANSLRALADATGEKFVRGVVLYLGEQCLPLSDQIWAVPVSALWE